MSHTAIPTQFSIKYWHDKTINTAGLWRLLPLAGLTVAAAYTASYYVVAALISIIKWIVERQRQDAAAAQAIRAVSPKPTTVQRQASNFSWISEAISEALDEGAEETDKSESVCTCSRRADKMGAICRKHGQYV